MDVLFVAERRPRSAGQERGANSSCRGCRLLLATPTAAPKCRDRRTYGGGLGNHVDVVALEDDLVLLGLGLGDGDALEQLDVADALLTEEVAERGRTGSAQAGAQRLG